MALRDILASEGLVQKRASAWKVYPKIGKTYMLATRSNSWPATFLGWGISNGEPEMKWQDADGMTWEAYIYDGVVSVGSGALRLQIKGEVD